MSRVDKVIFTVKETRTYTITASELNGWDMPETLDELVDMVNNVKSDPYGPMADAEVEVYNELVSVESNIIEHGTVSGKG